jgi:hypothetical protein
MTKDKDGSDADVSKFVDFIKSAFYATLDNMYEIQELSERVLAEMARKRRDYHLDADVTLSEYIDNARKGREEFKATMEQGFKQLEALFDKKAGGTENRPAETPQPHAKHRK